MAAMQPLQQQFEKIQALYAEQPYPSASQRKAKLTQLKALLQENENEICLAVDQDFNGRAHMETRSLEYLPSLMAVNDARKHVSAWMKPQPKLVPLLFQPAKAKVVAQPLGVVGIIVPWNYPLLLAIGPLIATLSAGNVAMIKMSEMTPKLGALLERLFEQYFPEGEVVVVNGELEVAQAFSQLAFDHLVFTGSTTVGKHIMRAASENLTPVTLELGGKSPAVIDRSIPIRQAAERLVYPKCLNAGQTCVAPDYALCPQEQVDTFAQHFIAEAKRQFADVSNNADYSAIINTKQRQRLLALLDDAKAKGAQILIAGDSDDLASYAPKLPPIIVTQTRDDMLIMQEEIFGPILPVVSYQSVDETLDYINARPRPLALYLFGYDAAVQQRFTEQTHSGALLFNEAVIHVAMDNLPFGGVGQSGMGQYHGRYGFETLSKLKPVVTKGRINSLAVVYPPYKPKLMQLLFRLFGR